MYQPDLKSVVISEEFSSVMEGSGSDLTLSIVQNNYGGPDSYSGPNYGKFMVGLQYMASK